MNSIALIIIYNHRFDKNIEILEKIYRKKFSFIYHLMPFYDGDKPNVIPVYENSHYFQGYVTQGLKHFFDDKFEHYFFIGDDVLLNPIINENNYKKHLNLQKQSCFLPGFITLHKKSNWARIKEAYDYKRPLVGVETDNQLPDYKTAKQIFKKFNLSIEPLNYKQVFKKPSKLTKIYQLKLLYKHMTWWLKYIKNKNTQYNLKYPIVGSYSDIFIISSNSIKKFCHYAGIFAASKLFVEIALPTSIVLSADTIITENDTLLKGRALWGEEDYKILDKYDNDLKKILKEFPSNYLYLHPIKLSKWNTNI